MRFPKREQIDLYRKLYPAGTRLKLVSMDDPQAPPEGTLGTVVGVDDLGDILMDWDNGSGLNLVPGKDVFCRV